MVVPWPISKCLMITVTAPSGEILTNGLRAGGVAKTRGEGAIGTQANHKGSGSGSTQETASGGLECHGSGLQNVGRTVNGRTDPMVGGAAAGIALHVGSDCFVIRAALTGEQAHGGHDLP